MNKIALSRYKCKKKEDNEFLMKYGLLFNDFILY